MHRASAAFSLWSLISVLTTGQPRGCKYRLSSGFPIGTFNFQVGIMMDQLSAVMVTVVSVVSPDGPDLLAGLHGPTMKAGYLIRHVQSLFTFSMLGLVLSNSLLFTFVFWEMVGLLFLLLNRLLVSITPSAANAARKPLSSPVIGDSRLRWRIFDHYFKHPYI